MSKFTRNLIVLVIVAILGTAVLQIADPSLLANIKDIDTAASWQREIGIWNIAVIVALIFALLKNSKDLTQAMTVTILILGILFGTNYLLDFLNDSTRYINLVGALGNYLVALLFILSLFKENRQAGSYRMDLRKLK